MITTNAASLGPLPGDRSHQEQLPRPSLLVSAEPPMALAYVVLLYLLASGILSPQDKEAVVLYTSQEERRNILEPSKGLCKLAENFLSEAQKDADNVGNIQPDVLIKKLGLGALQGYVSRLFEFGGETPEQVIINIIVSDGDPSRSQRESLLNAGVKQIGVANGKHDMYGHLTTIIVATKLKSNDDSNDKGLLDGEYIPKDLEKVGDNEIDEDVEKIEKIENIITEKGIKKKITKIIKYMKDGTKQIETYKEKAE